MSIHGDDVVRAIRVALSESSVAQSQTEARCTPVDDGRGWPNRDGRWEFDVVGRDWFRGFRITVESIGLDDVNGYLDTATRPDGSFPVVMEEQ